MTGLEPATSGVTGRHSNQLSYTRVSLPKRSGAPQRGASFRRDPLRLSSAPGGYFAGIAAGVATAGAEAAATGLGSS